MGIFDSLKNMTNQAVKNNVSKAVSGAVNNAMHKSKTFVFADYPKNADELKKMPELDFSSPLSTAAFAMLVLLEYDESPENTIEMLNVLKGPQPMNGMDIQFLRDRVKGRGYIPRSYFEGSSVKNDYTPNVPYKITVYEYAYITKGFLDFFNEVNADVFCLQETKLQAGQIDLQLDGYHMYWNYAEKKGYCAFHKRRADKRNLRTWN